MRLALIPLLIVVAGCSAKLSNDSNARVLACGASTPADGALVRFVGADGLAVDAADLSVALVAEAHAPATGDTASALADAAPTSPLAVTEKGCVALPSDESADAALPRALLVRRTSRDEALFLPLPLASTAQSAARTLTLAPFVLPFPIWSRCGDFPAAFPATDAQSFYKLYRPDGAPWSGATASARFALQSGGEETLPLSTRGCVAVSRAWKGVLLLALPTENLGYLAELTEAPATDAVGRIALGALGDEALFAACGVSGETRPLLKLRGPNGEELRPSHGLEAFLQASDGRRYPLTPTPRGCFAIPREQGFDAIVARLAGKATGVVVPVSGVAGPLTLRTLEEQARADVMPACLGALYTRPTALPLPIRLAGAAAPSGYLVRAALAPQGSAAVSRAVSWLAPAALDDLQLDLSGLAAGRYELALSLDKLADATHGPAAARKATCEIVVDDAPPALTPKPVAPRAFDDAAARAVWQPAEEIAFTLADDGNGARHFHAWVRAVEGAAPPPAPPLTEFQPFDGRLAAPGEGVWALYFYSRDAAGNASPLQRLDVTVFHDTEIALIRALLVGAKAEVDKDQLGALRAVVTAERRRLALPLALERASVAAQTREAFWLVGRRVNETARPVPEGHLTQTAYLTLSPDGRYLVAYDNRSTAYVYDAGARLVRKLTGFVLRWLDATSVLVNANGAPGFRIVDVVTGAVREIDAHGVRPYPVEASRDGRVISFRGPDERVLVWADGTVHTPALPNGASTTLLADGKALVLLTPVPGDDLAVPTLTLHDPTTGAKLADVDPPPADVTELGTLSPLTDGGGFVADANGRAVVWNAQGKLVRVLDAGFTRPIDFRQVLVGARVVVLYEKLSGHVVAFDLDGRRLFDFTSSVATGRGALQFVSLSADDKTLVTWGIDGVIRRVDMATGRSLPELRVFDGYFQYLSHSADASVIAVAGPYASPTTIKRFDLSRTQVPVFPFDPRRLRGAVVSDAGGVILGPHRSWTRRGEPLAQVDGLTGAMPFRVGPDGRQVVTVTPAGDVVQWRADGKIVRTLQAGLTSDGACLLRNGDVMTADGAVLRRWPADGGEAVTLGPLPGGKPYLSCAPVGEAVAAVFEDSPELGLWTAGDAAPRLISSETHNTLLPPKFTADGAYAVVEGLWFMMREGFEAFRLDGTRVRAVSGQLTVSSVDLTGQRVIVREAGSNAPVALTTLDGQPLAALPQDRFGKFAPDGRHLIQTGDGLKVMDGDGRVEQVVKGDWTLRGFSDGGRAALVGDGETMRVEVWDFDHADLLASACAWLGPDPQLCPP